MTRGIAGRWNARYSVVASRSHISRFRGTSVAGAVIDPFGELFQKSWSSALNTFGPLTSSEWKPGSWVHADRYASSSLRFSAPSLNPAKSPQNDGASR